MTGTWKTKGVSAKRLRYGRISSNLPLLFLALFFFFLTFSCLVRPLCPYSPLLVTFPLIVSGFVLFLLQAQQFKYVL